MQHAPANAPTAAEDYPGMYLWQQEAVQAWRDAGRRGVVQAVTGAGKTRIGIGAAFEALRQGLKVLVLVPTAELQQQWMATIREALPRAKRGTLGDGGADTFDRVDILVAIVHSAAVRDTLREHKAGLLIADECHRYAAEHFASALDTGYDWRLGLSATYAREDGLHESVLDPYFGRIVYDLWYERALAEKVIAPFKLAFISVELAPDERTRYDDLTSTMGKAAAILTNVEGIPREPFPAFVAAVAALAESSKPTPGTLVARRYMSAMAARREVLAGCRTKIMAAAALHGSVKAADRTLVFTQTKASAVTAAQTYTALGCTAGVVASGMKADERRGTLDAFRRGDLDVLAAPKVLDEGVDVPAADLSIVISASRSRRQMVQRLGRVIRRKPDRRLGRMAVLFCANTVEDPALRQEGHLEDITPHAAAHAVFNIATDIAAIEDFLAPEFEPEETIAGPELTPVPVAVPEETAGDFDYVPLDDEPDLDEEGKQANDLEAYMRSIDHEILTTEQEQELAMLIEAGLMAEQRRAASPGLTRREALDLDTVAAEGRRAREKFVACNLRLVVSYAKKYRYQGVELLDLIQEGNLGLLKAVQKFDYRQGNRFSTYASWWIRQSITRGLTDTSRTVRLPAHLHEFLQSLYTTAKELEVRLDRQPTVAEIAEAAGHPEQKLRNAFRNAQPIWSLDFPVSDGAGGIEPLGHQLVDEEEAGPEETALGADLQQVVHNCLDMALNAREATIMAMRHGLTGGGPQTLEAIGLELKLTRERIRQLEKLSTARLRAAVPPEYRLAPSPAAAQRKAA